MVGRTISHYRVIEKLGEGGMGVVYKAEDTQLRRTVALKFLPRETLDEEEVKARLLREAQAAAGLDHPNICAVHGIHEEEGETFIAMAYIDGPSLAEKIKERPLPLEEALSIATQIAEGLHEAHEHGVVHRDIKPQNILLTAKGQVKILDFGLASLTGRSKLTKTGTTLGTPAYMAPEQLEGRKVDRRADVWALGCVLYEVLTQKTPFDADYEQAIGYGILNEDPEPVTAQRAGLPTEIDRLITKALAKDPDHRYQHADDLLADLRALTAEVRQKTPSGGPRTMAEETALADPTGKARQLLPWAVAATLAAALAVSVFSDRLAESPPERIVRRFSFAPDDLHTGIIAPDGRHVAYITGPEGTGTLWLRPLGNETPRQLAAPVDVASIPCLAWSPDGSSIAFASDGQLKRVALADGAPVVVAELPVAQDNNDCVGAAWSPDGGSIVFGSGYRPYAVPAGGGEPKVIFETGGPEEPANFYSPHFLPSVGASRALVFSAGSPIGRTALWVANLDSGEQHELVPGSRAWYSDSGHLIHGSTAMSEPGLWVLPFSLDSFTAMGEPFRITQTGFRASLAQDGTMVYNEPQRTGLERLTWRDRSGAVLERVGQTQIQMVRPAVSPDGLLAAVASDEGGSLDIWVHDLTRGSKTRLTFGEGIENSPAWSPSGREVAYWGSSLEGIGILSKSIDDAADAQVLVDSEQGNVFDAVWLNDGQSLVYARARGLFGFADIWYATRREDGVFERKEFLSTPAAESIPTPSPDGRYLAYVSDESGRDEVYIRQFPDGSGKRQVSLNGGTQPTWRRDGRELFYVEGASLMAVEVSTEGGLTLGRPQRLFDSEDLRSFSRHAEYDVSPDGERFLTTAPADDEAGDGSVIRVVQNWYEQFRDREQ